MKKILSILLTALFLISCSVCTFAAVLAKLRYLLRKHRQNDGAFLFTHIIPKTRRILKGYGKSLQIVCNLLRHKKIGVKPLSSTPFNHSVIAVSSNCGVSELKALLNSARAASIRTLNSSSVMFIPFSANIADAASIAS